jgi:myo-inositol 2-dehydrogenase / D-chiro-inositol 1-dehydrogenase
MIQRRSPMSRRRFLESTAAGVAALSIVPRNVLGQGQTPPSEEFGGALIGCGGRGGGTFQGLGKGVRQLARCDVRFVKTADNKTVYTDFRRVLERKDIHVVAIATHPGWHALISIAAMEAGKDVLCEKPMCRFIAEGRAVVDAEKRYNRIFQIGTYGRFSANRQTHKLMASGLLKDCQAVVFRRGGFKVKEWSGHVNPKIVPVPPSLDWNMYCGPAPLRPFAQHRFGGTHRGYWDYEGGGLSDMGEHHLDGFNYQYAKDFTSPVQVEPYAPPEHPEAVCLWGWAELTYADGLTLVLESTEWGKPYDRKKARDVSPKDLSTEDQQKLKEIPDPERLVQFPDAIRTRKRAGGHAEAAHRTMTLIHLANVSFRTGRKLRYDPVREVVLDDEEANRLLYQPMRAPWRL